MVLVNEPGVDTWPLSGASATTQLDHVPIPENVYTLVQEQVWPTVTSGGSPVWP